MSSKSDTFIVTSNGDSGAGTFRQALQEARNNGDDIQDVINFSLPAGNTTITLNSALPPVGNVIINGQSQPTAAFGLSQAKVRLIPQSGLGFTPLTIIGNAEVYGLYITGFSTNTQFGSSISITQLTNAIIGAPGKGNVLTANRYGITGKIANAKIQSNFIGVDPTGILNGNQIGIYSNHSFDPVNNALIGGTAIAEGNLISGNGTGILLEVGQAGTGGPVTISNNSFSTNIGATASLPGTTTMAISVYGNLNINAINNVFSAEVVGINAMERASFTVRGNFFGTDRTGSTFATSKGDAAIKGELNAVFTIGGVPAADRNTFANYENPIHLIDGATAQVIKNSFYCNTRVNFPENDNSTFRVLEYTRTKLSGKGTPGSQIQLYYTGSVCVNCNPETWLANVTTDASGHWEYGGNFTRHIVASETIGNVTTGFQQSNITLSDIRVTPARCGFASGKIEILDQRVGDFFFSWTDDQLRPLPGAPQQVVENLMPGTYWLTYGVTGGCETHQIQVVVTDEVLIYNAQNRVVTNAVCDQAVGSITGITTNATIFEWRNGSGVLVSRELDLLNQPPAFYTLTLRNGFGCQEVLEPFHIQNRSTAISIFQSETIVADNCGLGRGRITGITHNADGPRYSWKNGAGVVVGTARDLIDVRAGIYELTITNRGGCTESRTYQVTDLATVLAAPIIEDQFVCSPIGITISFNANADIYRIYDANGTLLQESTAKTFKLDISNTVTYYAAVARGTCESTRTPFTITLGQAAVNIPTSFSPNNDGVNDFWVLKGIEIYNAANIKIFNRYGTIVYESTSNGSKPFDGKSKGADLPAGVYFYIIKLTSECDPFTGSVTILR